MSNHTHQPGPIVLFGSGETSPSGRKAFDLLMRQLPLQPQVALLETPAGFELNSHQVIGRVGEFITARLQNYQPQVNIVPARRRNSAFSPDDPALVQPMYTADMIFMGPGSPTYAVRQLKDSLAWQVMLACHRLGSAVVFASAAVVAVSLFALPVYEIYKVGEDLHWKAGLDFFGQYGLPLVFIPHWNNQDGGEELDTSRCFMGRSRFAQLMEILPVELTVVGIDEKTALIVDPSTGDCQAVGLGGVTLIHVGPPHHDATSPEALSGTGLVEVAEQRNAHVHHFASGEHFNLERIGQFQLPAAGSGIPPHVWQSAQEAQQRPVEAAPQLEPSPEAVALMNERQAARANRDWAAADHLRQELARLGWQVQDTPAGPRLLPVESSL